MLGSLVLVGCVFAGLAAIAIVFVLYGPVPVNRRVTRLSRLAPARPFVTGQGADSCPGRASGVLAGGRGASRPASPTSTSRRSGRGCDGTPSLRSRRPSRSVAWLPRPSPSRRSNCVARATRRRCRARALRVAPSGAIARSRASTSSTPRSRPRRSRTPRTPRSRPRRSRTRRTPRSRPRRSRTRSRRSSTRTRRSRNPARAFVAASAFVAAR